MLAVSAFFRDSNYLECAMWCSIGVAFLIRAMMRADHRTPVIITGITFLFFGASDYVEANGALVAAGWIARVERALPADLLDSADSLRKGKTGESYS